MDLSGKLVWAILAAVLHHHRLYFHSYEGLFAFERIAKLYRDAARNLRRVQPPLLGDEASAMKAVGLYVANVEGILERERGQWGQLAVERHGPTEDEGNAEPEP